MNLFADSNSPLGTLHALSALPTHGKHTAGVINLALQHDDAGIRRHATRLAESVLQSEHGRRNLVQLVADPDLGVRYQLAFTLGELPVELRALPLAHLLARDGGDRWMQVAALSSLHDGAGDVLSLLLNDHAVLESPAANGSLVQLARLIGRQKNYGVIGRVVSDFQRPKAAAAGVAELLIPELAAGNPRLMRTHLSTALDPLLVNAKAVAVDATAAADKRAGAVRLLRFEAWEDAREILAKSIEPQQPAEVQSAAVNVLATYGAPEPVLLLLEHWARLGPTVRREAEEVVCARPDGVLALLDRLEAGTIRAADLSPGRPQLLQASSDAEVKSRATALLAKLGNSSRQALVDQYRDAMNRRGDLERGRAAFRKTCAACHKLENFGYELGPNLATMKNRGPEAIVLNVLDPNREVNPQFQSYIAVTNDGLTHTGMIQSETATAVTLSRGENKAETLLRSDIEDLRSTGLSLMPEGLEKDIDVQTLADLLEYLSKVQ
jgi:putative heme-binding domain-containing protein